MKEDSAHIEEGPFLHFLEGKIRSKLSQKTADELVGRLRLLRHWSWDIELIPGYRRPYYDRITFAALFSFLATFGVLRTIVYLMDFGHIPNISKFFLNVRGVHVHHFTYGIAILALIGFISLISFSPKNKIWLALGYGTGLGFAMDEAGQWLLLQDEYWVRQSYDAVIITSLILLVIIYLPRYLGIFYKRFEAGQYSNTLGDNTEKKQDNSSRDFKIGGVR